MNEQDLKLIGAALLALKMAAEQVSDEAAKSLMSQAMEALMNGMGDVAGQAMDAVSQVESEMDEDKQEEQAQMEEEKVASEMKPEEEKKEEVASLKAQVATLASKLDSLIVGIQAGKLNLASAKTKVAPVETHGLSLDELNRCKEKGLDPEKYAASKARAVSKKK